MPTITLSSKHQVTLPADLVRRLGLEAGDKLVAELVDDHIVLLPKPESWLGYFRGSMKGVYGSTVEEIDEYIARERASPERWEWTQLFYDLLNSDPDAEKIVEWLQKCPRYVSTEADLWSISGIERKRFQEALGKLLEHGGVRKIPTPPAAGARIGSSPWRYYLVGEFAEPRRESA
jgi:AbrB family looped-hinge helix DNA binding protein